MPDKIEIFKKFYGPMGETYQEDDWLTNLGVFSLGWDMALKYSYPPAVNDNPNREAAK